MTFPALTLPTTAPMTHNALKQRAAQELATDWKPVHEFLPRVEGSIANHPQK
jgi:tRNA G46 methylase TrmB